VRIARDVRSRHEVAPGRQAVVNGVWRRSSSSPAMNSRDMVSPGPALLFSFLESFDIMSVDPRIR
jgi:hypothetical protein